MVWFFKIMWQAVNTAHHFLRIFLARWDKVGIFGPNWPALTTH